MADNEPILSRIVVDGVEIPVVTVSVAAEDESVARVIRLLDDLEANESTNFILSTASHS